MPRYIDEVNEYETFSAIVLKKWQHWENVYNGTAFTNM